MSHKRWSFNDLSWASLGTLFCILSLWTRKEKEKKICKRSLFPWNCRVKCWEMNDQRIVLEGLNISKKLWWGDGKACLHLRKAEPIQAMLWVFWMRENTQAGIQILLLQLPFRTKVMLSYNSASRLGTGGSPLLPDNCLIQRCLPFVEWSDDRFVWTRKHQAQWSHVGYLQILDLVSARK